jgi:plasmid stabilization system protein ParE
MSRYQLTKDVLSDIAELWAYIAEASVDAAERVIDEILDACALLADQAGIGHKHSDLTDRPVTPGQHSRFHRLAAVLP